VNIAVIVAETVTQPAQRLVAFAIAEVDVIVPAIDLEKTSIRSPVLDPDAIDPAVTSPSVAPTGGAIAGPDIPLTTPASYLYRVSNPGGFPLEDVAVTDTYGADGTVCPVAPVNKAPDLNVGDDNDNGLLDPTEVWEFSCVVRLSKSDSDNSPQDPRAPAPVTNVAVATGTPVAGGVPDVPTIVTSPQRSQVVEVIAPSISIDKVVDDDVVLPGTTVTYTMTVTNTGDSPFEQVTVVDDRCTVNPVPSASDPSVNVGDANADDRLDLDEAWVFTCDEEVSLPVSPEVDIVNTAFVLARGPLDNLYLDEDSATVTVFDPAIQLLKTARETLVPAGTVVTYDFEVTNVGDSPLATNDVLAEVELVDVSDPAQPTCVSPTFVGGDVGEIGVLERGLDPPEIWRYECTAPIGVDTVNVAVVGGVGGTRFDPERRVVVLDASAAFVGVFNPAIDVVKTASPTSLLESGDVTYTYEVRNTGDVPLADVESRIVDDRCAPVAYVSGDLDDDGLLDTPNSIFEDAADEIWIFTCTTRVTTDTVNVVTVTGTPTDPDGALLCGDQPVGLIAPLIAPCDVSDTATATVTVLRRGSITIVKDAVPNDDTSFQFAGTLGSFTLTDDGGPQSSRTFTGLAPGTYTVTESATTGWNLESISCVDPTNDSTGSLVSATATIELGSGENVVCTFRNVGPAIVPPLPPQPELPTTGSAIGIPALLTGLVLLGVGLVLSRASRRRRPA
jgi:hypothetical protein